MLSESDISGLAFVQSTMVAPAPALHSTAENLPTRTFGPSRPPWLASLIASYTAVDAKCPLFPNIPDLDGAVDHLEDLIEAMNQVPPSPSSVSVPKS